MKKVGLFIALAGIIAFILSFFVSFSLFNISLFYLSILIYTLGLYIFITSSAKDKKTISYKMITIIYATMWAYTLVGALSDELSQTFVALMVVLMSVNSLFYLFKRK